jgi:putative DNA-invertase from lambdoid prophage Rac
MSARVFVYCRVSAEGQVTDDQVKEIMKAGFDLRPSRITTEIISGSVEARKRPVFSALLNKMEKGDVFVVNKLDRLGRNAMDVRATIEHLGNMGVQVYCLALGRDDLAGSAGKTAMQVLNAVAEFERDLLIDRTQAGLQRARAEGKHLGRKFSLTESQRDEVFRRIEQGETISAIAREFKTSRQTILRVKTEKTAMTG